MISKIISRAACLAELTSNPKSFFNCPDLHGGVPGLPEVVAQKQRLASLGQASAEFVHANNTVASAIGMASQFPRVQPATPAFSAAA